MTEPEELVWFEADGTRHVFGRPSADEHDPTTAAPDESASATPTASTPVDENAAADRAAEPTEAPTVREPVDDEPAPDEPSGAQITDEPVDDEADNEPSAFGGMLRALALGAAAAAATGAVVGAISLAATGDRPDTTSEPVPSTQAAQEQPAEPEGSVGDEIERVDLTPPTTSADQPG